MFRGIVLALSVIFIISTAFQADAKPWPEIDPDYYTSDAPGDEWNPEVIKGADPIPSNLLPVKPADRSEYGKILSLIDCIDVSLRNSSVMKQAWNNARAAAAEWGISKSEYYPFLDGSATGVFGQFGPTNDISTGRAYGDVSLGLQYLLLDFGGREARVASAKQAAIMSNWMHNQAVQDILRDVPQAYYYHTSAKALQYAAEQSLRDANTTLDATKTRKEAGVATVADVLQARASQQQAVVNLEAARGTVKISRGQLASAMGWPANTDFETRDKLGRLPVNRIVKNVNKLVELARTNRPEINAAMANLRKREADLKNAQALSFPKLNGIGNVEWRGTTRANQRLYYGGVQLSIPIFHGFKIQNSIRKARDELESAKAKFRQTDENVIQDTWSAYYNFKTAKQQVATSRVQLASSQESYKVSLERYKVGAADIVELLNAQAMLAHARAQLVDSRMKLYTSFVDVLHAIGSILPHSITGQSPY